MSDPPTVLHCSFAAELEDDDIFHASLDIYREALFHF